jgi:hypothetical protein
MPSKSIFYSWQSDSPASTNRSFIETALKQALKRLNSDAELNEALRESRFVLEKDTLGVSGSPPIAETILTKINQCAVFVADLTYVASSIDHEDANEPRRMVSNPNVLIEYGYALRALGHHKVIGVINTAFGEDHMSHLPFDLKHLRWPITYNLKSKSDSSLKTEVEELTKKLAAAIKPLLLTKLDDDPVSSDFVPTEPLESSPAFFSTSARELIPERTFQNEFVPFDVANEGLMFLQIWPRSKVAPIPSSMRARDYASTAALRPLGKHVSGWDTNRNAFGGIVHSALTNGKLFNFTQLFNSWEIWGVDAYSVNKTISKRLSGIDCPGYLAAGVIALGMAEALHNYRSFYCRMLPDVKQFKLRLGLCGVKGYPISVTNRSIRGECFENNIITHADWQIDQQAIEEILSPFLSRMWEDCGFPRPIADAAELAAYVKSLDD